MQNYNNIHEASALQQTCFVSINQNKRAFNVRFRLLQPINQNNSALQMYFLISPFNWQISGKDVKAAKNTTNKE